MAQNDSKGRTVLQIIAKNEYYSLLENDDVVIIITKMWIGSESYNGLYKASTIATSFTAPLGSDESLQFMKGIDTNKSYIFQYKQWREACSLRFIIFRLSILFLIVLYQILIYTAIENNAIESVVSSPQDRSYLVIICIWIIGIDCEQILRYIFTNRTKRNFNLNGWVLTDMFISILIIVILIDIPNKFVGPGKHFYNEDPAMVSAILHCIMILLICVKFVSLLLTSEALGKFLSMSMLICSRVFTFLIIYIGYTLCTAAIFTLLFNDIPIYSRIDYSLQTLFMATIGPFDITVFVNESVLGPIMIAAYMLLAHVLLLNLLIGIINHVFDAFTEQVESDHCSTLIKTYYDNQWDTNYGMLIFSPTPITGIALILSPLVLFSKNREYWNDKISRVLYLVYAIPQFCIFTMWNFIYLPLVYIKGFVIYGKTGRLAPEEKGVQIFELTEEDEVKTTIKFSFNKSILWIFIGIPWLIYAIGRDSYQFWTIAYNENNENNEENEDDSEDVINYEVLKMLIDLLEKIDSEKKIITPDELYNDWVVFQSFNSYVQEEFSNENIMKFFEQFTNPKNEDKIEISYMLNILIKKTQDKNSKDDFNYLRYYNVGFIIKAIGAFQRKVGLMQKLSKMKLQEEEAGNNQFEAELDKVEQKGNELKDKAITLAKECRRILKTFKRED